MIEFELLHPLASAAHLGHIPEFLSENDPEPAAKQFDHNYSHGGGWSPMAAWRSPKFGVIQYPGDEPLAPIAMGELRNETIFVYQHAWVAIWQKDGSFQVSRMD